MTEELLTLTSLPLFPLGTVLFPGGVLPLRVFEVRYLDMIGKCHRAGAPFGVVALTQGHEVRAAGAPPEQLATIGTLAHITTLEQPQAGLLLVQCRGEQRFRIDRPSQLKHGLWVADVSLLPPDRALAVPELKQQLVSLGIEPAFSTPEALGALVKSDIPKWADIVKRSGATVD